MSKEKGLTQAILAILPGVDCGGFGGCGYPTCSECAAAIAETGDMTLCPACGQEDVSHIAELLGKEPVTVEEKLAFVLCAGDAAGKSRFSSAKSCRAAKESGFGSGECSWGCVGVGSCIDRCKFDAMSLEDGSIKIDGDKCSGCMACLDICPQHIITMIPKDATNYIPCSSRESEEKTLAMCGYGCIGCGDCERACPQGAVAVREQHAVIDYEKCVGCVACTVECQKKIIVDMLHDLTKMKEEVAFVRCSGGSEIGRKLNLLGIERCSDTANLSLESMDLCRYGCTGLGDCTKVCRFDAISLENGVAHVDCEKCVGCGDCMRECPRGIIEMTPYLGVKHVACISEDSTEERLRVCGTGCIGCGDCAENCPAGAIAMIAGRPVTDSRLCENCGICSYVCSRQTIRECSVPEYRYMQADAMKLDPERGLEERM